MKKLIAAAVALVMSIGCLFNPARAATIANFTAVSANGTSIPFPYQYLLPPSYNATGPKYPLVVFLHGIGERGTDNMKQMQAGDNTMNGALYLVGNDTTRATYPFIFVAPQCPDTTDWSSQSASIVTLINTLSTTYNVDTNRIIITGLSLGGLGTWTLIQNNPGMFAAAVPVTSAGDPSQASKLVNMPIWAFLDPNDYFFPLTNSNSDNSMVEAIRAAGGKPIFTLYTTGAHSVWTWGASYRNPLLIPWMMAQRKGQSPVGIPGLTIASSSVSGSNANLSGSISDGGLGTTAIAWFSNKVASFSGTSGTENGTNTFFQFAGTFTSALNNGILDIFSGQEFGKVIGVPDAGDLTMDHNLGIANNVSYKIYASASLSLPSWTASVPVVTGSNLITVLARTPTSGDPGDPNDPNNVNDPNNSLVDARPSLPGYTFYNSAVTVNVGTGTAPAFTDGPATNSGLVSVPYSFTYTTSGSPAPTFSVTGAPSWLSITSAGVLSGTPTVSGVYTGTVTASNGVGTPATQAFSITINAAPSFSSGAAPGTATVGVNYNNASGGFTFTSQGYPTPALTVSGTLPPGLTFTPGANGTATLSGQPTSAAGGNTYNFVVTATNNYGSSNHTATQNVQVVVAAATSAPTITGTAPSATVNVPYTYTYSVTGSPTPTVTLGTGSTLPTGLSLSGSSITGTPTGIVGNTYTGTVVATNGIGSPASVAYSIKLNSSSSLPTGWASQDVGTTGATGSSSYNSGTGIFSVNGSGSDIWGYNDSFQFLYQSQVLSGDGTIIAKLNDTTNTAPWAKAGIMMRSDFTSSSTQAMVCGSPTGGGTASFMWRATTGGVSNATSVYYNPTPIWYKLTRSGNVFTGYYSANGTTWTQIDSQTIVMPNSIYVGMVECSTVSGTVGTAHFSNVSVSAVMSSVAIGDVTAGTGSGTISGSTYSVACATGASDDIWGTSDTLEYLYEPMAGDGTVIVQITGITNTSPYCKGGIMIRKDLTPTATHASVFYTPAQGTGSAQVNFYWRSSQGGLTNYSGVGGNYSSTVYLKLTRTGSSFTGYVSTDGGATYTSLGTSGSISGMTGSIYVGVVECSHTTTTGTATYNNVQLP